MPKENQRFPWKLRHCRMSALHLMIIGSVIALLYISTIFMYNSDEFDYLVTECKFLFTHYDRVFQKQLRPPIGKQFCSTGIYQFEYADKVLQGPGPKSWEDVEKLPCKYINLGADTGVHPNRNYLNYVGVQGSRKTDGWGCHINTTSQREECGPWCVCHDLRDAIPLPNSSVDRFHSEEFMEHIDHWHYAALFKEFHRLLKPGGRARMAMPDYSLSREENLKMQAVSGQDHWGSWARHKDAFPDLAHKTLTNYALLKKYVEESPFKKAEWLHYYDNTVPGEKMSTRHLPEGGFRNSDEHPLPYVGKPINHTLGMVKDVPGVDCRNNILRGSHIDSLVFDLVKE